jgi:hypothetical protein
MPNAVEPRGFRKGLGFKPSRTLLWSRFGQPSNGRFPWVWFWPRRVRGRARHAARPSPQSDGPTWWAWSLLPPSGNLGHHPGRLRNETQVGVRLPSACGAGPTISPFRYSRWPSACHRRPGRRSVGGKARKELCALGSSPSACVPRIAMTSAPHRIRRNGLGSNGPNRNRSPPKTGDPLDRRKPHCRLG